MARPYALLLILFHFLHLHLFSLYLTTAFTNAAPAPAPDHGYDYDYIVVGAGTSGLVVANRLSSSSAGGAKAMRVAVVEPGGDERDNPLVASVSAFGQALATNITDRHPTAPQPGAAGRSLTFLAGRGYGGTSLINGMTYIRGDSAQFDAWEALGNPGWNWAALLPYFRGVESFTPPSEAQARLGGATWEDRDPRGGGGWSVHGRHGPLKTGFPWELSNGTLGGLAEAAWAALGYGRVRDVNAGGSMRGFAVWPQTVDRDADRREDAASAFLYPVQAARGGNLVIVQGTVSRVIWEGGDDDDDDEGGSSYSSSHDGSTTAAAAAAAAGAAGNDDEDKEKKPVVARGVEYVDASGRRVTITAAREVILSAGALRTPLILERSGVGNPHILESHGITPVLPLPGVGEHLKDQPNIVQLLRGSAAGANETAAVNTTAPYVTYATARDLFGGDEGARRAAAASLASLPDWARKTALASGSSNETRVGSGGGGLEPRAVEAIMRVQHDLVFGKNVTVAESLTSASGGSFVSAYWATMPFSWGSVHIGGEKKNNTTGAEEESPPSSLLDPRFFAVDFDLSVSVALSRLSRRFWDTEPVSSLVLPEQEGVPASDAADAEWVDYIRKGATPNNHPISTAAMMSRELGGVVDPRLKVYGTSNLRVVDASVLPLQVSGHLTATLYAVAERAAEFIKEG